MDTAELVCAAWSSVGSPAGSQWRGSSGSVRAGRRQPHDCRVSRPDASQSSCAPAGRSHRYGSGYPRSSSTRVGPCGGERSAPCGARWRRRSGCRRGCRYAGRRRPCHSVRLRLHLGAACRSPRGREGNPAGRPAYPRSHTRTGVAGRRGRVRKTSCVTGDRASRNAWRSVEHFGSSRVGSRRRGRAGRSTCSKCCRRSAAWPRWRFRRPPRWGLATHLRSREQRAGACVRLAAAMSWRHRVAGGIRCQEGCGKGNPRWTVLRLGEAQPPPALKA